MAILKTFRGIRPQKKYVKQIASKPYDVLNEIEARKECEGNSLSFYHVIKPEIDFPDDHDHYAADVYQKGASNFQKLLDDGILFRDDADYYYIYAQTMNGKRQYGIVGCASIDDYFNNVIRKHELTRPDKEEDRKNHIRYSKVNNEPVFFAYRANKELDNLVAEIIENEPEYDFVSDDGIGHTFWVSRDKSINDKITAAFAKLPSTYVADGHHRTAAAALVGKEMREKNKSHTGKEEYNFFLAVHFPDDQLTIMDYNRVVKDLNGLSSEEFLKKIQSGFEVEVIGNKQYKPQSLHEFGMYLDKQWYRLKAKSGTYDDKDPIGVLDVTILSKQILEPILNIKDLRTDKRIEFVGGLRGLEELERRVNSGEMRVAFAMFPVTMKQLIDLADNDLIMPPKVTWFEPKLRSGIIVHDLK